MKLQILGCSGGVGQGLRTTSLLLDEDILIDAGSGVGDLRLEEMLKIRHVFLTHCHLDHIAFIPLLLDSTFENRGEPLIVHGLPATLAVLQKHIFNWVVWPDFSRLPSVTSPLLRYEPMRPGEALEVHGRRVDMIPVVHAVPAVGYRVECLGSVLAFSGDTTTNDTFWSALNAGPKLDVLIVETAFCDKDMAISRLAKHYCPSLLADDLKKLRHDPDIYITHNKPNSEDLIIAQCRSVIPGRRLYRLQGGATLTL